MLAEENMKFTGKGKYVDNTEYCIIVIMVGSL